MGRLETLVNLKQKLVSSSDKSLVSRVLAFFGRLKKVGLKFSQLKILATCKKLVTFNRPVLDGNTMLLSENTNVLKKNLYTHSLVPDTCVCAFPCFQKYGRCDKHCLI